MRDLEGDAFNTEHVMPRAFGTFEQNFTLNDAVCADCNNFFSTNLELFFARDSFEAYDRVKHGLKPVEDVGEFPQDRLTFSVAEDGKWCGLRLRLRHEGADTVVDLVPQVGFRTKRNPDWFYLTEEEVADPERSLPSEISDDGIKIIAPSDEAVDRLTNMLCKRGISFQKKGDLVPPTSETGDIEIFINTKIDPIIKRCAAKIAFNYLTYTAGRDFVLHEAFNVIRAYICAGESPGYLLVDAGDRPILANDTKTLRQTEGHLITVNWTADKKHVVGQVSLFNRVTYRVGLARDFAGVWTPIRSGHHFDLQSRRITSLAATSLIIP